MTRNGVVLGIVLAALVSGCIPRSATTPIRTADAAPEIAPEPDAPRIDPQMDTVFDEAPVWEMRPVVANAASVAGSTYTVVAGDTLRSIGNRTGAGSETLARANGLTAPFIIRPGQTLTVPAGRYHNVGEGETGIAIARAYGIGWQEIIAANALEPPYSLRIGQRLLLPGDALESRASAFKLDIEDILTGGEPAAVAEAPVATPQPAPTRPLPPNVAVKEPARFAGSFAWPADGRVANRFGPLGEGQVNQGIDIAVAQSAPISAAADGVVAFVGNDVANYGGLILIRHGEGWITAYGRATQASVTRGQSVKKGQSIGKAGSGTAPLLFFQMRKGGKPVDPVKQLPAR
jgi:murein DD-endopeptidase MepM/ murein hydrolase activator NlpD